MPDRSSRLLTAGEWLFRRGDAPCGLYAVARGSLSISGTAALQENTRTALLTLIEPPSWLGEIALFDGEPRTHDAHANTACALLQVPIVIRTTENMLKLVPDSLREAAYALGTPKWKMISAITLKASVSGIMTGILLAVARIAGETAPLLFTSLSNQFWSTDMMQPIANLPVTIFKFAMSPFAEWQQLAWAGVLIITLCVLLLNILARVIFAKKKHG